MTDKHPWGRITEFWGRLQKQFYKQSYTNNPSLFVSQRWIKVKPSILKRINQW